jgi:hypothetical protein
VISSDSVVRRKRRVISAGPPGSRCRRRSLTLMYHDWFEAAARRVIEPTVDEWAAGILSEIDIFGTRE